jgi:hypothetical protein
MENNQDKPKQVAVDFSQLSESRIDKMLADGKKARAKVRKQIDDGTLATPKWFDDAIAEMENPHKKASVTSRW